MNLDNIFINLIQDTLQIGDITTKSVSSVTLIGNIIDSKLNFKEHINNRKKAYYKLHALRRLRNILTQEKSISLMSINLDVLLKSRYAKNWSSYNNYMATYDDFLALENKLKTHQSKNNLEIKLPQVSWGKNIMRKISHIH